MGKWRRWVATRAHGLGFVVRSMRRFEKRVSASVKWEIEEIESPFVTGRTEWWLTMSYSTAPGAPWIKTSRGYFVSLPKAFAAAEKVA